MMEGSLAAAERVAEASRPAPGMGTSPISGCRWGLQGFLNSDAGCQVCQLHQSVMADGVVV
jgi:hypothetical protein